MFPVQGFYVRKLSLAVTAISVAATFSSLEGNIVTTFQKIVELSRIFQFFVNVFKEFFDGPVRADLTLDTYTVYSN